MGFGFFFFQNEPVLLSKGQLVRCRWLSRGLLQIFLRLTFTLPAGDLTLLISSEFAFFFFSEKYQFNLDHCYMYYFDQNNNSANYTPPETTTTSGSAVTILHQTEDGEGKDRTNCMWT
jgi:hypothetical protein